MTARKKKVLEDIEVSPPGEPMPNVRRFLDSEYAHAERYLIIHQGGQYYQWDGTCWPALDDQMLRSELYQWFEDKEYPKTPHVMAPFGPTSRKVSDLMDAMRAITIIDVSIETPAWLNEAKHPADQIVSCENGLVHWPSRKLLQHRPGFYAHHSVPFAFDPKAPAPERWLAFLDELWPDDPSSIDTLQEIFGYLVSGDTRQQKMFLIAGPKRGGKGTIGRVLTKMLGRHNVAGPTLAGLGADFGMQGLIGKPVAIISDARLGSKSDGSIITERLLSISGEDKLTVNRKFLPAWDGYLPTRIVVLSNELPRFTDSSGALASRFMVLMLDKSFYGNENPALTEELCEELPGIFNWALDGLQQLRARGRFEQPASSADAIREMEDLASPVGAFIRDRCELGHDKRIEVDLLYQKYRQWCDESGYTASSKAVLGRNLRSAARIKRSQIGAAQVPTYAGIGLKDTHVYSVSGNSYSRDTHVSNYPAHNIKCTACDGFGCPTCKPENFGLPPRKERAA